MKSAAIVLIAVLNQGYWIGGQTGKIDIQWTDKAIERPGLVEWQLMRDQVALASGSVAIAANDKPATIALKPPEVRAVTELRWSYTIKDRVTRKVLAHDSRTLHLYPADLLKSLPTIVAGKSLAVWDRPDGLPALLTAAKVPFTRLANEADLHLQKVDLLIVGTDQILDRPFSQATLLRYVAHGTAALVLRQTQVKALAGYPVQQRLMPKKLVWRDGHPLLQHLRDRAIPPGQPAFALQLPADEPALELVYWPREMPGAGPVPIDALMVTKSLGRGRLVLCQIPLGSWQSDPVAQLALVDAIDYLESPIEPTLAPSRRPATAVLRIVPRHESQLLDSVGPTR